MNTPDFLDAIFGRHQGPSADWQNYTWTLYIESDRQGGWYLTEDDTSPDLYLVGYQAASPEAPFEIDRTFTASELVAWVSSGGSGQFIRNAQQLDR